MSACLWVIGNSPPTAVKLTTQCGWFMPTVARRCVVHGRKSINDGLHQKWLRRHWRTILATLQRLNCLVLDSKALKNWSLTAGICFKTTVMMARNLNFVC